MKYRLIEKIGTGGMAEVFRAVGEGPQGFERPFVVKRIHPHLSDVPEFVRMFVDEAKISARLIHPNITQVFEFGHHGGHSYIVMEPVDGFDMGWLRRQVERRRELLPTTFVAEVGRQACRGLDFAHMLNDVDGKPLGIVHRDVTPPNIMVAWNGTVKVLDFGIARAGQALRTNQTDPGMVKGKMSYVAPELLDGKTADARSDVFSLGVVLHELLSGRQLFVGETDLETLKLVKEMPIRPPSAHNRGVKPALDRVVMRALDRDPDKRYRSAGEMGDDLEVLVLRKSYSTRDLARTARELFIRDEGISDRPLAQEAPINIGWEESSVVAEDSEDRSMRSPATIRGASTAPGRIRSHRRRWIWIAFGLPAVLAVALVWAVARQSVAVTRPDSEPPPSTAPSPTVRIVLDSVPQGAIVTAAAIRGGERLGQTPLLLNLPRSQLAVDFVLTKPAFVPLAFKVIPHQDKDVIARLESTQTTPAAMSPSPVAKVTMPRPVAAARHTPTSARVSAKIASVSPSPRAINQPIKAANLAHTTAPSPTRPASISRR